MSGPKVPEHRVLPGKFEWGGVITWALIISGIFTLAHYLGKEFDEAKRDRNQFFVKAKPASNGEPAIYIISFRQAPPEDPALAEKMLKEYAARLLPKYPHPHCCTVSKDSKGKICLIVKHPAHEHVSALRPPRPDAERLGSAPARSLFSERTGFFDVSLD